MSVPMILYLAAFGFVLLLIVLRRPEFVGRPELDDDAFYEKFYAGSGIPKEILVRLRRLYVKELGREWRRLVPQDNPANMYDDLDLADLFELVGEHFGVPFPLEDMERLDGSFDAVVRYVAERVQGTRADAALKRGREGPEGS